jgi:hypothetical protein
VRFFISGSAALNAEIAQWFHAAGIIILEGYGMTENAAGATVNHLEEYKMGTVGRALPGTEVRIGEGDEVQLNGPHIMEGYHNLPEKTAETFTEDGWLRTGDKGSLDEDGFLTITGRIKLLITTIGLRLRRAHPELFLKGEYVPLDTEVSVNAGAVAFARVRLWTTTAWPARLRVPAIAPPMRPVPITATRCAHCTSELQAAS